MPSAKTVLVTGAGGYIGRHVVNELLQRGFAVKAVDIDVTQVDERAERIRCDLFSGDEGIYEALGRPDICLHMAWKDGFVHNAESHLFHLPAHYLFLRNMIRGGLRHLAVMGTMHEVGYYEGAVNEDTPTNPLSMYGIAKNTLRQMLPLLIGDLPVTTQWLRAYYILGDDLKNNSIFSRITKLEQAGEKTFPFTSGKNQYDFISVEVLARQIACAITQSKINGVINCCSGTPVSLRDKVEEFLAQKGFSILPQYGAFPERPYDSPAIWGDATKIREIMKNG